MSPKCPLFGGSTVYCSSLKISEMISYNHSRKLRKRDASKFHVQLSLAMLGMLIVFVVGIERTDVFEVCITVSVLIHYFTLVSVMWMGAEAVLMFRKLVIIFVQITTRYIIIVSLVCWCKGNLYVNTVRFIIPFCVSLQWFQLYQLLFQQQWTLTSWLLTLTPINC